MNLNTKQQLKHRKQFKINNVTQQETKGTDTTVPCPAALGQRSKERTKPEFPVIRKTEKTDFRLTKLKKMAEHTKARVSNVILEITLIKDIQKKLKIST